MTNSIVGCRKSWRSVVAAALMSLTLPAHAAGAFVLVTDQEYQTASLAPKPAASRGLPTPDAPKIIVESPTPGQPSKSPATIAVRFVPAGIAKIKPTSFRILYGSLKFDVTERVLKAVQISESGFKVDGAQLPRGDHFFRMIIEDNQGHRGEQEFRFEII